MVSFRNSTGLGTKTQVRSCAGFFLSDKSMKTIVNNARSMLHIGLLNTSITGLMLPKPERQHELWHSLSDLGRE